MRERPAAGRLHRRRHRRPAPRRARRAAGAAGRPGRARAGAADRAARRRHRAARGDRAPASDAPPDIVVANTGIGMRGWLEAAEGWGLAEPLQRGARPAPTWSPAGPRRAARSGRPGLVDQWSPDSESCDEVLDAPARRAASPASGSRCSCTASEQPEFVARAARGRRRRDRGAGLPLGAAGRPGAAAPAGRPDRRRGRSTRSRSPPRRRSTRCCGAGRRRTRDAVLEALRADVLAACVGPVTAAPLRRRGRAGGRARPGPGSARWSAPSSTSCPAGRAALQVAGHDADPARPRRRGRRRAAPAGAGADGGAAGAGRRRRAGAVPGRAAAPRCRAARTSTPWRWRSPGCGPALGGPELVQTVVKRGYRLRLD